MRLPDDDELYEVDQTYLGPPGRTVGPVRYKTLLAWILIGPFLLVVLYKTLPMNLLTAGMTVILITWLAMRFADWASSERPVMSVFATAWNELTAKRGARRGSSSSAAGYGTRRKPPRAVARWQEKTKGA